MQTPSPPSVPPGDDDGLIRCLDDFSTSLAARYLDDQTIPSTALDTKHFLARAADSGDLVLISLRHHETPLDQEALSLQQEWLRRMETSPPLMSTLLESRQERYGHYVVSSLSGTVSLHQLLRQHRRLTFAAVCQLLGTLAEALEQAAAAGWPRCLVNLHCLYISSPDDAGLSSPLQLVVPPLPTVELLPGSAPSPVRTQDYIVDLALITCELLGMPARGQRFRPLPALDAATNQILRAVIEEDTGAQFESAANFVNLLRSGSGGSGPSGRTTAHLPLRGTGTAPSGTTPKPAIPAFTNATPELPSIPADSCRRLLPLSIPTDPGTPPLTALRLHPIEGSAILTLCTGGEIRAGRSPKSHQITQFPNKTPRDEQRTRLISREHLSLQQDGPIIYLKDLPGANLSFINGRPLPAQLKVGHFLRVSLAGEYELEIRRLDSWWPPEGVWQAPTAEPDLSLSGSLLLAPADTDSAESIRTLWIFSDAAFSINPQSQLCLQPVNQRDVLGWFLTIHGSLWILPAEGDGSISLNHQALAKNELKRIAGDDYLQIGSFAWNVKELIASPNSALSPPQAIP